MTTTLTIIFLAVFTGYFALAGYDLGVGIILHRVAVTEIERRVTLGALGPFFLANEVWLVAGIGMFLALFPLAEGKILSSLYPILIPLVASIVIFTAAVQLRSQTDRSRRFVDVVITVSATIVALGWGAVFGAILQGFPLRFGPMPVVTALLVLAIYVMHGAALLSIRVTEQVRRRALGIRKHMIHPVWIMVVLVAAIALFFADAIAAPIPATFAIALLLIAIVSIRQFMTHRHSRSVFAATTMMAALPFLATVVALGDVTYPHTDASQSVRFAESIAGESAQVFLVVVALPVVPLLFLLQAVMWWIWRAPVKQPKFY